MMNRARVLLPNPAEIDPISFEQALQQPLAEQYGAVVEGVSSQAHFHDLLVTQGAFMLNSLSHALGGEHVTTGDPALRQLGHKHEREVPFFEDGDPQDHLLEVRVMYPFTPQYGYMQPTENAIKRPLRMTFGLARKNPDEETFTVGHTNLWVAADRLTPREGYRALKDTIIRKREVSPEEAQQLLSARTRSRARSSFVIDSVLED